MSTAAFWHLTPREFAALRDVQQQPVQRWGIDAAMFANAHRGKDDLPYEPNDFIIAGHREWRRQEKISAQMDSAMAMANVRNQMKQPGWEPPAWAKGTRRRGSK